MYFREMPRAWDKFFGLVPLRWVFLPVAWVAGMLVLVVLAPALLVVAFLTRHAGEPKGIAQYLGKT